MILFLYYYNNVNFSIKGGKKVQHKRIKLLLVLFLIFILTSCTVKNLETNIGQIKFNDIKFVEDYNYIKKRLKLSDNAKLQNLFLTLNNDYYITLLQYELIDFDNINDKYKIYHISLIKKGNKYEIYTSEGNLCLQYDQLIDAKKFFHIIENIDITKIINDNSSLYYDIYATGKYDIDATHSDKIYIIEKNEVRKADYKTDIEGYYIDVTDDKSVYRRRYFFGKTLEDKKIK